MKELSYFILQNDISNGEEPILAKISYRCRESDFDRSYTLALEEAYNGEVTVEEAPDEPSVEPTTEQRISDLEEQLAQSDETAIALYEAKEEQEVINAQQDEALMEIYEMIGL